MQLKVRCPACGKKLRLGEHESGKRTPLPRVRWDGGGPARTAPGADPIQRWRLHPIGRSRSRRHRPVPDRRESDRLAGRSAWRPAASKTGTIGGREGPGAGTPYAPGVHPPVVDVANEGRSDDETPRGTASRGFTFTRPTGWSRRRWRLCSFRWRRWRRWGGFSRGRDDTCADMTALKGQAETAANEGRLDEAVDAYRQLDELVDGRQLRDPALRELADAARTNRNLYAGLIERSAGGRAVVGRLLLPQPQPTPQMTAAQRRRRPQAPSPRPADATASGNGPVAYVPTTPGPRRPRTPSPHPRTPN